MSPVAMKRMKVVVPWPQGLHLWPAARLVQVARRSRSTVRLCCGDRSADLRSLFSVVALCATMGTALVLEVSGDDESLAADRIVSVFAAADGDGTPGETV